MEQDIVDLHHQAKRFVLRRRMGEGAFGVVWEAYDRERGGRVALKTLVHTEPAALYLFKKEFRALADIVHPNLVTLYELLSHGDRWFFTMEFVEGVDFVRYVMTHLELVPASSGPVMAPAEVSLNAGLLQPKSQADLCDQPTMLDTWNGADEQKPEGGGREGDDEDEERQEDSDPTVLLERPSSMPGDSYGSQRRFDADRLRSALRQLATGLNTLHDAGKLHRDIKPSNVLVTREGRVIILDFGLITELAPTSITRNKTPIVGTPIFMAPEQGRGAQLSPAADWYSVGVMLYMAMTGRVPFDGPPMLVLLSKQEVDATPPGQLVSGLPADLETLCIDLLRRDPEERPTGRDVLRRLGVEPGRVPILAATGPSLPPRLSLFVGRQSHLAELRKAYEMVRSGQPAAALVYGHSGMGKTALIRQFLADLKDQVPEPVVLTGRCYQRESVPYKALDSLVDELSVYLQNLPPQQAGALLPRGLDALARLFPVLRQVEFVARHNAHAMPIADPHELRRRAFSALRELLARLASQRPLVLFIDDLQWSDADSDALLAEIVRPPNSPPLLFIACYRADHIRSMPLVVALDAGAATEQPIDVRELCVKELSRAESEELANALLDPAVADRAIAIAREAEGNPLFIDELTRHARAEHEAEAQPPSSSWSREAPTVKLTEVIQSRVAKLPTGARRLLEIVVVAGRPIDSALARRAAGVDSHEQAVLSLLQVMHLVQPRSDSAGNEIEVYHDRIRDSVLSQIDGSDLKAYHNRLAITLEADGRADPERLATHFQAAGRQQKAAFYALRAADEAFDALAFDRAASLYQLSLSLNPAGDPVTIRTRLGESLANAGRGGEAADAYLAAAEQVTKANEALDLRRRAAEQLLISGHVEPGIDVVRQVLSSLGMKLPETPRAALFSLLRARAQLRIRGLKFREKPAGEITADELMRIDTCWAISAGLSLVDPIRGTDFQSRHLLLALKAGEPYRLARALAVEVAYCASNGPSSFDRANELVRMSMELAEKIQHPHALGLALTMAGAALFLSGQWRQGLEYAERGATMLRERCSGVTWEIDTADAFVLSALQRLGRWNELGARLEEVTRSANARGDLYAATQGRLDVGWCADLALDTPDVAQKRIDEAISHSSRKEFQMKDSLYLNGSVNVLLYRGEAEAANKLLLSKWDDLRRSFTLEVPMAKIEFLELRARCAIACATRHSASKDDRKGWIKSAERDAAGIDKVGLTWAIPVTAQLRANIATVQNDVEAARSYVVSAEEGYKAVDMELHSAVAHRRHGNLLGDQGAALVADADARLAKLGVKSPSRFVAWMTPGWWRR